MNNKIYKNPAETYLLSLNSNIGARNSRRLLNRMCFILTDKDDLHSFDWSKLNYTLLLDLKTHFIEQGLNSGTINTYLANLKGVAREAWKLKTIKTDDYLHIKEERRIKYHQEPCGKAMNGKELKQLVRHCEKLNTLIGVRNAAMIALAYGAGLRVHELAKLKREEYNGKSIQFIGKGRKQRTQPLPYFVITILDKWLKLSKHIESDSIFLRVYKGNRLSNQTLHFGSIGKIFKRIEHKDFRPHDLRSSLATNLLDSNVDVILVSRLMGHSNINTTMIYDKRGEKAKEKAVELLPF